MRRFTNSLHAKLMPAIRRKVERDLIAQPPGRSTYLQVYKFYGLDKRGVSIKALERFGAHLRAEVRGAGQFRRSGRVARVARADGGPSLEHVGELLGAALTEVALMQTMSRRPR